MTRRVLPAILALALLVVPFTAAQAQTPAAPVPADAHVVWLGPSGGSGVQGIAWIYPEANSQVTVTTFIWNLEPNSGHSNHIHRGSCEQAGGIVYNLTDLMANDMGYATSSTVVDAAFASLFEDPHFYVNVHTGILGTSPAASPGITCGNIENMMMMGGM
jgi:hypothetical protein